MAYLAAVESEDAVGAIPRALPAEDDGVAAQVLCRRLLAGQHRERFAAGDVLLGDLFDRRAHLEAETAARRGN